MLKITNMVLEISCLDCIIARTPTINTLPKPLALSCYPDVFFGSTSFFGSMLEMSNPQEC